MLEELVKKDNYWRRIAFNICRDEMLSDDLVQEMYIRMSECRKEINDYYVIRVIINLFKDQLKQQKKFTSLDDNHHSNDNKFDYDDNEKEVVDSLSWWEKELIELTYNKSFHEIEREYNINYQFSRRVLIKAKNKWQDQKRNIKD